jgi:hypothetical protein
MPISEHDPRREADPTVLSAFQATFIPRTDQYPMQQVDGTYLTIHRPLQTHHLQDHLAGKLTLGAYALNAASLANWIVFDADDDEKWNGLLRLAETLQLQLLSVYLELSRRGGHLWLFTAALPGMFARRFAKQLLTEHNLEEIEIYPKQDQLIGGSGSLVRLPFGVHRKSGKVYPFIHRNGQALAPTIRDQVALLSSPARVPLPFVLSVLSRVQSLPLAQPEPITAFHKVETTSGTTLSERLKGTISVLEFVRCYVQLDRNHTGFCPFHDDQHPSFAVNEEYNYWHCFAGCGGGSIIDFWMKWREKQGHDGSFKATITELRKILL